MFWCASGYLVTEYRIKQIKWIIQWEFLFNSKGNLSEKLQLYKLEAQMILKYAGKMLRMHYLFMKQKGTIHFHYSAK